MAREQTFGRRLRYHRGGLVRVRLTYDAARRGLADIGGKIGLLMGVKSGDILGGVFIELLIDGRVRSLLLYPGDLEFLGADDAS
jgi:hypothetical protein